jgi:hypothetical protein
MKLREEKETHETESLDKQDRRKLMRRRGEKETHETNRREGNS